MKTAGQVAILGVFVADAAYRASRLPVIGETLLGSDFTLGPGGKGSNQAVAAARAGANVNMITRLGDDDFADMALALWQECGVTPNVERLTDSYTGSAFIFVDEKTGDNAIIIAPGAASTLSAAFVESMQPVIAGADVFMTQLEQPLDAAEAALGIARDAGVTTILNTAPAEPVPPEMFALCDYVTPNETETAAYTGCTIGSLDDARTAADRLLDMGVGTALITLGEQGVLLHNRELSEHIPAMPAGKVIDTTGAGDAFNGGFASALAAGIAPLEAARFGCAVAGLSVTRRGAAASMPSRQDIDAALANHR